MSAVRTHVSNVCVCVCEITSAAYRMLIIYACVCVCDMVLYAVWTSFVFATTMLSMIHFV